MRFPYNYGSVETKERLQLICGAHERLSGTLPFNVTTGGRIWKKSM